MTFMRIRDGNVEVSQFGTDQVLGDSPSDEELRASLMESITPVPGIPSDQVEKVRSQLSPIELGIERNGLNTNNVSSDFSEEMSMRGAPKGTWGLYLSRRNVLSNAFALVGRSARWHTSTKKIRGI